MKTITANKSTLVKVTDSELLQKGIVAVQMVEFVIEYFGRTITVEHDTKITKDGQQTVIGGCGFIPEGYEVA